jgi:hypothetical protein
MSDQLKLPFPSGDMDRVQFTHAYWRTFGDNIDVDKYWRFYCLFKINPGLREAVTIVDSVVETRARILKERT